MGIYSHNFQYFFTSKYVFIYFKISKPRKMKKTNLVLARTHGSGLTQDLEPVRDEGTFPSSGAVIGL